MEGSVRPASGNDAAGIHAIYAPVVTSSYASFETEAPTIEEMHRRIETTSKTHPYLVAEEAGTIVGYAYAGVFNARAAYRYSTEVTVYVAEDHYGLGLGRSLLDALLADLIDWGFVTALAGIALPNDASVTLFERAGFRRVALYENVGYKLGAWRSVGWWQKVLRQPPEPPP